jgi:predicted nucleic acid-binding protein
MIVVDASAITELLLQTGLGIDVEQRLYRGDADDFHAPHLLDVEVLSALRRLVRAGEVPAGRAEEAIEDLALLRIIRHEHLDLAARAWQLRRNFTAYDAMYLALAESLDATVLTCDSRLSAAPGHAARVDVIRRSR